MTAVEWLEDELKANLKKVILEGDSELMESLFEQAKEMEKEQIKDAYYKGGDDLTKMHFIESEQYYKLTFKSE